MEETSSLTNLYYSNYLTLFFQTSFSSIDNNIYKNIR